MREDVSEPVQQCPGLVKIGGPVTGIPSPSSPVAAGLVSSLSINQPMGILDIYLVDHPTFHLVSRLYPHLFFGGIFVGLIHWNN